MVSREHDRSGTWNVAIVGQFDVCAFLFVFRFVLTARPEAEPEPEPEALPLPLHLALPPAEGRSINAD